MPTALSQVLALNWMKERLTPEGGLSVSNINRNPYPEVTGYSIPTFLRSGERSLATKMARWLVSKQGEDGSFPGIDGEPQVFDTAQVLRGILAVQQEIPEARKVSLRAASWMVSQIDGKTGAWTRSDAASWVGIPEAILLYAIRPLEEVIAIERGLPLDSRRLTRLKRYYIQRSQVQTNSHFLGYIAAGLFEIGLPNAARKAAHLPSRATWPGTSQLAEIYFRLGEWEMGERLLRAMAQSQQPDGGWTGGAPGYFEKEQISWAPKFYLDACACMQQAWFQRTASAIPALIAAEDERVRTIIGLLGELNGKRLLEVGCGKGRYLRHIQHRYPRCELYASDISPELLRYLPAGVHSHPAPMSWLPYPEGYFDAVVCIEALEHAVFVQQALQEIRRVTRPGGRVIIVDKDNTAWGALPVAPWEQWFGPGLLANSVKLAMDGGLFRAWYEDVPPVGERTTISKSQ